MPRATRNACTWTVRRSIVWSCRNLQRFAQTADAIAGRTGKHEKVEFLAAYFRSLDEDDLAAAARFFTGRPFAARDPRTLSLGSRAIVDVAQRLWQFDDRALGAAYRSDGDLGTALGALFRPPAAPTLLPADELTPAVLAHIFGEIAAVSGARAAARRAAGFERILRACNDPRVVAYAVKIVTGDLRAGLREGLVLEAIARAFDAEPAAVRHAMMALGDAGATAVAAQRAELAGIRPAYGSPIGFMLASPMPHGQAYPLLDGAAWAFEDKYDGIRAQAHVRGGVATLYSRTLNDVTAFYPEVTRALANIGADLILDGEIVAAAEDRALPFRRLQTRLRRKDAAAERIGDTPLTYVAFDLLADGDELLLEHPYVRRRERLDARVTPAPHVALASFELLDGSADPSATVNDAFDRSRGRGNEGLVLKRLDSPYAPGRRGRWWLKLKRELATLDVAVIAVEWGHGKRAKVLSDYTFAVRDDASGELRALGKAYSGLTDAEIAELTLWFLARALPEAHRRSKARRGEIPVEPGVVLEVAFDVIQESDLHESGFALRFPRIVRIRNDKPVAEIDTLARVREIYEAMQRRERG